MNWNPYHKHNLMDLFAVSTRKNTSCWNTLNKILKWGLVPRFFRREPDNGILKFSSTECSEGKARQRGGDFREHQHWQPLSLPTAVIKFNSEMGPAKSDCLLLPISFSEPSCLDWLTRRLFYTLHYLHRLFTVQTGKIQKEAVVTYCNTLFIHLHGKIQTQ